MQYWGLTDPGCVRAQNQDAYQMEELDRSIDLARPRELILDLKDLRFTDSSGIAVLLRSRKRMEQAGGSLRVVRVPEQADKVFRAAGLSRIIRFE